MGCRESHIQAPVRAGTGYFDNSLRMVCVEVQLPPGFVLQPESVGTDHHSGRIAHHYEGKPAV